MLITFEGSPQRFISRPSSKRNLGALIEIRAGNPTQGDFPKFLILRKSNFGGKKEWKKKEKSKGSFPETSF